ncbi:MAG: 3-isopropylmalate dehydratase small subunit [Gammaproteobacteria bacterium]|jgi:3-isopropylmalate/(R)-2-methylmalate dehydratase small subunit|nr:MAG: 3-isopropylmalate dehydratase small subunit [Gammaproteobacteria bacterium]
MKPYEKHTSIAALLNRSNVDTDQIIPKQFLKKVERSGFGIHLFHDWRFLPDGRPNPDFELNKPAFQGARILVAGDNFGCGSSREHAPWAIADYGFNTIIATSFADIFFNNCFKNGILPITVDRTELDALITEIDANPGARFTVDLEEQTVETESGRVIRFTIDDFRKKNLLKGLDEIGLTLEFERQIAAFEAEQKTRLRWLWN